MAKNEAIEWVKICLDHTEKIEERFARSLNESEQRTNDKLKEQSTRLTELNTLLNGKVSRTEIGWLIGIVSAILSFIANKVFDIV